MKYFLMAATLLFYTQATEKKKCIKEYIITNNTASFKDSKDTCQNLPGGMASEDLKDSENAIKAELLIKDFHQNSTERIWLGIAANDTNEGSHPTDNPFVFSDGTDPSDDSKFVFKWATSLHSTEPDYSNDGDYRCTVIRSNGTMMVRVCDETYHALCKTFEDCNDENSPSSESKRFRSNLPVFALFMACSVLKSFYSFVGFVF